MRFSTAFLFSFFLILGCSSKQPVGPRFAEVVCKDFVATVSDLGEVGSEEEFQVIAPFTTKINWMKEEGSMIKRGDRVAELDTEKQKEELETALLSLDQKSCDLAVEKANSEDEVFSLARQAEAADHGLSVEKLNLNFLLHGRDQTQMVEVSQAIKAIDEQISVLAKELPERRSLYQRGFASKEELDKAEALKKELDFRIKALRVRFGALEQGPLDEELAKQRGKVAVAKAERDRLRQSLFVAKARRPIDREDNQLQLKTIKATIEENEKLISACQVRAPQNGMLVYGQVYAGDDMVKVSPGDSISEGDTLARLSNPAKTLIRVSCNALDLAKLKVGQSALFTLDAYSDQRFEGVVSSIGAVGQPRFRRDKNDVRVVEVGVRATRSDPRIKPGMTANVEIETSRMKNSLVLPLQAILHDKQGAFCLLSTSGKSVRTPITVLDTNETEAAIAPGLKAGDRVELSEDRR
ncbi:MAG TPA: hypothetical protein DD435_09300 [Cyanobacteria bacterium UBA8530]|nr:hypothetical protein [Cyanobacteria bacterium UBA8530]